MNIEIDKLTPCLEEISTGKIVNTFYSKVLPSDLKEIKGWNFKWLSVLTQRNEVYKLEVENDSRIQGLVAIENINTDKAVYVKIAESAPHNLGAGKEYLGVGGHLFAIAVKRSFDFGYDGFVYMDAKNIKLVEHYTRVLGATFIGTPHPFRMAIDERAAKKLLNYYNFGRN